MYKIKLIDHLKIGYLWILPLGVYIILFFTNLVVKLIDMKTIGIIAVIIIAPQLYVHLIYYIENYKTKIIINYRANEIHIINRTERLFNFKQITKIEHVTTSILVWSPFANYHYYNIYISTGEVIFISCLLIEQFPLIGKENIVTEKFFPIPL